MQTNTISKSDAYGAAQEAAAIYPKTGFKPSRFSKAIGSLGKKGPLAAIGRSMLPEELGKTDTKRVCDAFKLFIGDCKSKDNPRRSKELPGLTFDALDIMEKYNLPDEIRLEAESACLDIINWCANSGRVNDIAELGGRNLQGRLAERLPSALSDAIFASEQKYRNMLWEKEFSPKALFDRGFESRYMKYITEGMSDEGCLLVLEAFAHMAKEGKVEYEGLWYEIPEWVWIDNFEAIIDSRLDRVKAGADEFCIKAARKLAKNGMDVDIIAARLPEGWHEEMYLTALEVYEKEYMGNGKPGEYAEGGRLGNIEKILEKEGLGEKIYTRAIQVYVNEGEIAAIAMLKIYPHLPAEILNGLPSALARATDISVEERRIANLDDAIQTGHTPPDIRLRAEMELYLARGQAEKVICLLEKHKDMLAPDTYAKAIAFCKGKRGNQEFAARIRKLEERVSGTGPREATSPLPPALKRAPAVPKPTVGKANPSGVPQRVPAKGRK